MTDPYASPQPTTPKQPRTAWRVALVAAAALLVGLGIGAGATAAYDHRDEIATKVSDVEARASGTTQLDELEPGICFDELPATEGEDLVDAVQSRACTEPHEYQVFATITFDQVRYPGEAGIEADASEQCYGAYDKNQALVRSTTEDQVSWYSPTASTWSYGDRAGTCLVSGPTTKLTAPLPVADPRA